MKARRVRALPCDRTHPAHQFLAHRDSPQDVNSAEPLGLGHCKHGWNDNRARMHRASFERVVEILAMRRGAVDHRGGLGPEALLRTDDRTGSGSCP